MTEGAEHDGDLMRPIEVVEASPRLINHLQRVDPYVALGMPFGLLRTLRERLQLGEQRADDAQLHRQRQPNGGPSGEQ